MVSAVAYCQKVDQERGNFVLAAPRPHAGGSGEWLTEKVNPVGMNNLLGISIIDLLYSATWNETEH